MGLTEKRTKEKKQKRKEKKRKKKTENKTKQNFEKQTVFVKVLCFSFPILEDLRVLHAGSPPRPMMRRRSREVIEIRIITKTKTKSKRNKKLTEFLTPSFEKQSLVPEKMVYFIGKRVKPKTDTKWLRNVIT